MEVLQDLSDDELRSIEVSRERLDDLVAARGFVHERGDDALLDFVVVFDEGTDRGAVAMLGKRQRHHVGTAYIGLDQVLLSERFERLEGGLLVDTLDLGAVEHGCPLERDGQPAIEGLPGGLDQNDGIVGRQSWECRRGCVSGDGS